MTGPVRNLDYRNLKRDQKLFLADERTLPFVSWHTLDIHTLFKFQITTLTTFLIMYGDFNVLRKGYVGITALKQITRFIIVTRNCQSSRHLFRDEFSLSFLFLYGFFPWCSHVKRMFECFGTDCICVSWYKPTCKKILKDPFPFTWITQFLRPRESTFSSAL